MGNTGRARRAPARVSRTPIGRGHAVIPVAMLLLVGRCVSFVFACPVGCHDHEIAEFPVPTPNLNYPPCPGALPGMVGGSNGDALELRCRQSRSMLADWATATSGQAS